MAASLGIDSSVLASRSALEAIVERRAEGVEEIRSSGRLNRWQAELLEPIVREVLSS
jgi:hypothetical protein